jgi:hypothetical protein
MPNSNAFRGVKKSLILHFKAPILFKYVEKHL